MAAIAPADSGLSSLRSYLYFETAANPIHPPATNDELGYAVASGDFDGDGFADLAIGLPGDDNPLAGLSDIGQVQIRWGGPNGLDQIVLAKYLWQGGGAGVDSPEPGDRFGASLAAGDFDDDGFDDLVIGAPGEDIAAIVDAGAVEIRYGDSDRSLALDQSRTFFHENSSGVPDNAGTNDQFGYALATGDFDNDGFDDLAVGIPLETSGGDTDAGRVIVLYGAVTGLGTAGAQTLDKDSPGFPEEPSPFSHFGLSVAAADFDLDGFCDLAIGEPDQSGQRGSVVVATGSASGLSGNGQNPFRQGFSGLTDFGEEDDVFGYSLAVGHFNADAYPDLAIGVPGEGISNGGPELDAAGAVHVLFGGPDGLVGTGSQFWTPLSSGVPGEPEVGDSFGFRIAAGDFNGDSLDELVIGVPFEQNFVGPHEGDTVVLTGTPTGPTAAGSETWNLQVPGIAGDMNTDDTLGWSLTTGDFDSDGHDDLAIGIPYDGFIGGALVLRGALFADDFAAGTTARWSAVVP